MANEDRPVEVYGSDDYAGMKSPRFTFYFGYEKTRCPHHGDDKGLCCDDSRWCFTASHMGEERARYTQPELEAGTRGLRPFDEMCGFLLAGIGKYLS